MKAGVWMPEAVIPREIICKSALNKTGIPGYEFCMNPYVGCMHRCVYCYASFMCRFTGHGEPWGTFLDVKVNFPEILKKQLGGRTKKKGRVILGTVTDVYQPAESRYGLTRACLEILADYPDLEAHILTKSALIVRDIDILCRMAKCEVGFTITTVDDRMDRIIEPGASPPGQRLDAARQLAGAGIPVWVFVAPLLPGLTDGEEALHNLLAALKEAGIKEVLLDALNPYPAVVQRLRRVYRSSFPYALPELENYLRQRDAYEELISVRIEQAAGQLGCKPEFV